MHFEISLLTSQQTHIPRSTSTSQPGQRISEMSPRGSLLFMRSLYSMSPIADRRRRSWESGLSDASNRDSLGRSTAGTIATSTESLHEGPTSGTHTPSHWPSSPTHQPRSPTSPTIRPHSRIPPQSRSTSPRHCPSSPAHSSTNPTHGDIAASGRSATSAAHLSEQQAAGGVEQEITGLRDAVSELKASNDRFTARLDRLIDKLEVNHFPTCPILYERMVDPQRTRCGHIICRSCISKWLRDHDTCPCCRQQVRHQDLTPVGGQRTENTGSNHSAATDHTQSERSHSESQQRNANQSYSTQASASSSRASSQTNRTLETNRARRRSVSGEEQPRDYLDFYRSLDDEREC